MVLLWLAIGGEIIVSMKRHYYEEKNEKGGQFTNPRFSPFEVYSGPSRSQSTSIINGVMSSSLSYTYALRVHSKEQKASPRNSTEHGMSLRRTTRNLGMVFHATKNVWNLGMFFCAILSRRSSLNSPENFWAPIFVSKHRILSLFFYVLSLTMFH